MRPATLLLGLLACGRGGDTGAVPAPPGDGGGLDTGVGDGGAADGGAGDGGAADDTGGTGPADADGDGFPAGEDCDDADATVYPGAPEVCGDGVVNGCDEEAAREACVTWDYTDDHAGWWNYGGGAWAEDRIAAVGDVNGDGLADVGIGCPVCDAELPGGGRPTDAGVGAVFLAPYAGDEGSSDGTPVYVAGLEDGDYIGNDLSGVGDLDGDGYADVVVGAPTGEHGRPDTPSAYLLMGPGEGLWADEAPVFVGEEVRDGCLGATVAAGPDGDGDGIADVLVGAQCWGEVYLFSGDVSSLPTAGWTPGRDELARFYVPEEAVEGDDRLLNEMSRLGFAMTAADVDGDGVGDAVLGAPFPMIADSGRFPTLGNVLVFHGPFPAGTGDLSWEDADQVVAGSEDSTVAIGVDDTIALELGVGLSVADLDGDGALDLVAGAPYRTVDPEQVLMGAVFGWFDIGSRGDVDTTGADFVIDGVCLECDDGLRFGGELDASGDFDGDGHRDLAVAGGWFQLEGSTMSAVQSFDNAGWLFLGPFESGSYLSTDADAVFVGVDDGNHRWAMQVSFVGDTDGDGTDDLLFADNGAYIGLFSFATRGWVGW